MKRKHIQSILDTLEKQVLQVSDPASVTVITSLFNLVESLIEQTEAQAQQIQTLKDEINQLKGEQGKPKLRKQSKSNEDECDDHSSEEERKKREPKKPRKPGGTKKSNVTVDRTVEVTLDKATLPVGGHSNGIIITVVQDINFGTDNIEFRRETYYIAETGQYFIASLPEGYDAEYGPKIKAFIKAAYSSWNMTLKNITAQLKCMGVQITISTVSRMALNQNDIFHQEKRDVVCAGLQSTSYQHLDDTSGRECGQNCYVNILANPYYTAYFTLSKKDRLTMIELLSFDGLRFSLNQQALTLMEALGLPERYLTSVKDLITVKYLTRTDMDRLLTDLFPNPKKHKKHRKIILEACAITAYQSSPTAIMQLIVDDAPQFKLITQWLGLCWIHEGRHFKKMNPVISRHTALLETFREQFWDYYQLLLNYKENPSDEGANALSKRFDELFSQTTGYDKLDKQIALTLAKKEELLLVLKFPFIPIHNNPAELGARVQARNRDIHLHTMTEAGTMTKDTLATLSETANKLAVNFYEYALDRITKKYKMLSLAELIKQHSVVMLC